MITITPLKGTKITKGPGVPGHDAKWSARLILSDDLDTISFGRDYSMCDVVFASEHAHVSGRHLILKQQGPARYSLTVLSENFVYIDGVRAWTAVDAVTSGARLNLVTPSGPGFVIDVIQRGESPRPPGVERTIRHQPRWWEPARIGAAFQGVRRTLLAIAALTAASITGVVVYTNLTRHDTIDPDEISLLSSAAYAVIELDSDGRPRLQGTAWPVAPDMLATNAHVANLFTAHRPNLIVRRPSTASGEVKDFTVTGVRVHPGFGAFARFDAERRREDREYAAVAPDDRRSGYDVALLMVDDPTGALGPILRRATAGDLTGLMAGDELAYAGYPIAGSQDEKTAHEVPTPQIHKAGVVALTDYYLSPTDQAHAFLVQNSLPAFKGASGSPVINAKGEVVGILSGGHVISTPEGIAANAIMRNFAQRVDLLDSLFDDGVAFDIAGEQAHWEDTAARASDFRSGKIEEAKRALLERAGAGNVTDAYRWTGSLAGADAEGDGFRRYVNHEIPPLAPGRYALFLYGDGHPMVLSAFVNGVRVALDTGAVVAYADIDVAPRSTIRVMIDCRAKEPVKTFTLYVFRAESSP